MINPDITTEELEYIERFLQNDLSPDELAAFQARLDGNEEFRKKTEQVRLWLLGIAEVGLEERMNDFHQRLGVQKNSSKAKVIGFRWLAIAASVALVVSFGAWVFLFRHNKQDGIYASYYKPDPGLMTPMGSEDNYDFGKAMVAYRNGEYEQALNAWKQQLNADPANDTLIYFVGASYQAMEQVDSANVYLEKVTAIPASRFYKDANWYLALLDIRANQRAEAVKHLRQSAHGKSEELIQRLEK